MSQHKGLIFWLDYGSCPCFSTYPLCPSACPSLHPFIFSVVFLFSPLPGSSIFIILFLLYMSRPSQLCIFALFTPSSLCIFTFLSISLSFTHTVFYLASTDFLFCPVHTSSSLNALPPAQCRSPRQSACPSPLQTRESRDGPFNYKLKLRFSQ